MAANVRPRDRSAIRARGGGSGIAGLASFAPDFFNNPTLVDPKTGLAISLTRATTATYTDQDLIVRTALSGMARMQGMRVVRSLLLTPTENITTGTWADNSNVTATAGISDPFGTTKASTITATGANAYIGTTPPLATGSIGRNSCWIRRRTGSGVVRLYGANNAGQDMPITSTWQRFATTTNTSAAGITTFYIFIVTSGDAVDIAFPMAEDVTGQTIQTPGEYQSVGILATPYQGLGVDGAKAYTTTNGNTVASNVVTEAAGTKISSAIRQGFLVEAAATNICLQSNALTTTWTAFGTPAATQNVTGPDGATSAWTLTDNSAGALEGITQNMTLTAAAWSFSFFVKKTTGAQPSYPVVTSYIAAGTNMCACTIDTSNGIATNWTAYTAFTMAAASSATIVSFNADYWRVTMTRTGTAASYAHDVIPAGTTNPTQSTGVVDATAQGSAVFYGFQEELGSVATSYIPTTTTSVTRNADVASVATGTWFNATLGTLFAQWINTTVSGTYVVASFNDTTAGNVINIQSKTITTCECDVTVASVAQSALSAVSTTSGTTSKAIASYKANSFYGYANNTTLGTDVSGTIPTVTRLELGGEAGATQLNGVLQAFQYYPTVLNTVTAKNMTV
jgi:hypothetical protein